MNFPIKNDPSRYTALIVEDDYLIAIDIKLLLEEYGWHVLGPVPTVEKALLLLENTLPSVAVLDVNLGGELVTPVAEFLKSNNVPFVMATAYSQPEVMCGEIVAGIQNVGKPAGRSLLLSTLDSLIDRNLN